MSNPTTKAAQFNGSLDGFSGSGAVRYSNGLYLEEATTNLWTNPRADVNTSGVEAAAATTLSRSTAQHMVGPASFRSERNAGGTHNTYHRDKITGFAAGDPVAFSVYGLTSDALYARLSVLYYTSGDALITTDNGTYVALPAAFDRLGSVFTCPATTAKILPVITFFGNGSGGASATNTASFTTEFQVEKKPYLTSYADASLGDGYAPIGTLWASAHTRAASSASISPAGILSPSSGAIAFRITPTIETGVEEIWGECGVKGSGTDHVQWGRDASKHPFVEWSSNDASYQRLTASETWNALVAKTLYLGWDSTTAYLQVDSGTLQTHARDAVSASWGAGNLKLQASKGGNIVAPFSAYSEHLNDTDRALVIAAIAAGGSNLATVLDDAAAPLRTMNIRTNALLRQ